MKRLRKNFSVFFVLALILSFFSGNLVVFAAPDDSGSETDPTPVISDKVDGENAKVFSIDSSIYDTTTGGVRKDLVDTVLIGTFLDDYIVIIKTGDGYLSYNLDPIETDEMGQRAISDNLEDAYNASLAFKKGSVFSLHSAYLTNNNTIYIFKDTKCVAKTTLDKITDICDCSKIATASVSLSASDTWRASDNTVGDVLDVYVTYNLPAKDSISSIKIGNYNCDFENSSSPITAVFSANSLNSYTLDYEVTSLDGLVFKGKITLPEINTPSDKSDNTEEQSVFPVVTFNNIPDSIEWGSSFKLTMLTDSPAIMVFNGSELSPDYEESCEVEVFQNGEYTYTATSPDGSTTEGVLKITCFEDKVETSPEDTYWNGVDDSSKKLAQTGLFNNTIFIVIISMLVVGIALITYVFKFRKRGANNEE